MASNPFIETFRRLPVDKLVTIIDHPKDYPPLALDTAKNELLRRRINELQLDTIRKEVEGAEVRKKIEKQKNAEKINSLKSAGDHVLSFLDPFVEKSPQRMLNLIALGLVFIAVFKIITNASMLWSLFENVSNWDHSSFLFVLDALFLPLSVIPFIKKRVFGLVLVMLWLLYLVVVGMWILISTFRIEMEARELALLLPAPDPGAIFMSVVISLGLIIYLARRKTRTLFH